MNLPIAERELRVAARDRKTYRGRLIVCLVFGAVAAWVVWAFSRFGARARLGQEVFTVLSMLAFVMVIMSVQATADTISSEKREGTLGFLFLTDLRGYDIVFGKLAAQGIATVYGLVAALPIIALPLLIGGVEFEAVLKTSLGLVNTLFFALSLGLWISSRSFEQKKAIGRSVQFAMFFWMGIPLLALLLEHRYGLHQAARILNLFAPGTQLSHGGPFGIGLSTGSFGLAFLTIHLMAWAFLLSTCIYLPKAWQDRPRETLKNRFLLWWDQTRYGDPRKRLAHRQRLLERNAVLWLCGRELMGPGLAWAAVFITLAAWIGLWLYFASDGATFAGIGMPSVIILSFILFLRALGLACEVIARDRQTGALELLLATRLSLRDMASGHMKNVIRICAGPIIATYFLGFLVLQAAIAEDLFEADVFIRMYIYLGSMYFLNLIAAFWTGMWLAASVRNPASATGFAVLRILVLPLVAFALVMSFLAWLNISPSGTSAFTTWWIFGLVNAAFWSLRSRQLFYENLRGIAAERYQLPPGGSEWWSRFFSIVFGKGSAPQPPRPLAGQPSS